MECIILVMVSGQSGQYHERHHTRRYEVIKNYTYMNASWNFRPNELVPINRFVIESRLDAAG